MRIGALIIGALFIVVSCSTSADKSSKESLSNDLFNGKDLSSWRGDSNVWSVEDGCIVGKNTDEYKVKKNTFLIHENPYSDFELTFQYKIIGGNSGVQYRAKVLDENSFVVGGYQADMEAGINHSGILYEEKGRGIVAKRGEQVLVDEKGERTVTKFAESKDIQAKINMEEWNDYRIVANGTHLQHFINETKTIDVTDNEVGKNASSGIIALQVHAGPNMKVFYKNIVIKPIKK